MGSEQLGKRPGYFLRQEDCRMTGGKEADISSVVKNPEKPREGKNVCKVTQQETGSTQANRLTEHFPVFHGLGKEKLLFRRDFWTPRSSISPSSPNLTPPVSKG